MAPVTHLPCVLFALERERLFLHRTFRIQQSFSGAPCPAFLCHADHQAILVIETGVGVDAALRAVNWMLERPRLGNAIYEPSFLLFAGFAGALQSTVHVGDLIFAEEVLDTAGRRWLASRCPASRWPAKLAGVTRGRLLTTPRFIGEPAEKLALGHRFKALAVDMESAAFAQRCTERSVPWSCLRVISDDVHVPFPVEVAELVEGGRAPLGRVLRLLLRKPHLLPKLVRLGRQTRHGARRLAQGVIQFLECCSAG